AFALRTPVGVCDTSTRRGSPLSGVSPRLAGAGRGTSPGIRGQDCGVGAHGWATGARNRVPKGGSEKRTKAESESVLFAVAEQSEGEWWCDTGTAQQWPAFSANQPVRRLVIADIPQLYSELQNRANKLGLDLSAGDLFLRPDDPFYKNCCLTEYFE